MSNQKRFALIGALQSDQFDEAAQDAVGSILVDSSSIDFTYTDATPSITAAVIPEFVQDTVGAMLADTATVDLSYNDGAGTFSAATIAAGVLAQLLTVDGAGSGLDADLLDGLNSTAFALASTAAEDAQDAVGSILVDTATIDFTYSDATPSIIAATIPAGILAQLLTVDGAGSGLDADLLDGNSSAFFLPAASYTAADVLAKLLTVDGAASGLDADLLDGNSSAAFALAATTVTAGGGLTGSGTLGANLTLAVGAGTGITVNADDIQIAAAYLGANPSASVGLAAVNGSATSYMRSDGAPALSQTIVPTWTGLHTFSAAPGYITINDSGGTTFAALQFTDVGAARGYFGLQTGADQLITGGGVDAICFRSDTGALAFSANSGVTLHLGLSTVGAVSTPNARADEVGFKGFPVNDQNNVDYTTVLADAGKMIYAATSGKTITIDGAVAYPNGTVIRVVNLSGGNISIAITTDNMYLEGTGFATSGTRTLASGSMARITQINSTNWLISGSGLT